MPNGDNHTSLLASYDSLTDPHLAGFFSTTQRRQHLRRAGLIKRNGEIVSEKMFRLNMNHKEDQRKLFEQKFKAISEKKKDLEIKQQLLLSQAIDNLCKTEKVQQAKGGRQLNSRNNAREHSAGGSRYQQANSGCKTSSVHRRCWSALPHLQKYGGTYPQLGSPPIGQDADSTYDEPVLPVYPTCNVKHKKRHNSKLENLSQSPYLDSNIPSELVSTSAVDKHHKKHRRLSPLQRRASSSSSRKVQNRKKNTNVKDRDRKSLVEVNMHYFGTPLHLECYRHDGHDQVMIEQQHCGGNTLTVFNQYLLPGDDFTFVSQRHRGFPFSATIYVNGIYNCRLSACCEYRHTLRARLGAKGGHFSVTAVNGGRACYRCRANNNAKNKELTYNSGQMSDGNLDDDAHHTPDKMLYIPVDTEDEIIIRPVDSDDESSDDSEDSTDSDNEIDTPQSLGKTTAHDDKHGNDRDTSNKERRSTIAGGLQISMPNCDNLDHETTNSDTDNGDTYGQGNKGDDDDDGGDDDSKYSDDESDSSENRSQSDSSTKCTVKSDSENVDERQEKENDETLKINVESASG